MNKPLIDSLRGEMLMALGLIVLSSERAGVDVQDFIVGIQALSQGHDPYDAIQAYQ